MSKSSYRLGRVAIACLAGACVAGPAIAGGTSFGPHDVPTVFFISKSNGSSRVDYGVRLDEHCAPARSDAVFPYWRESRGARDRVHSLNVLDQLAYGIAKQGTVERTTAGGEQHLVLKQVKRPVRITTSIGEDGRCRATAHSPVGGVRDAELVSIFAQVSGPFSVDYIDVRGRNPATGQVVTERIRK